MAWFILSEDEGTPAHHERREEAHSPLAGKRIVHHDQNQVPSIHPERKSKDKFRINENEIGLEEFNPT